MLWLPTDQPTDRHTDIPTSSVATENFLVKIWDATAAFLRSNFEDVKFANLIAGSESLLKSIKRESNSFFDILTGAWSNNVKILNWVKFALLSRIWFISMSDHNFDYVPEIVPDGTSKKKD